MVTAIENLGNFTHNIQEKGERLGVARKIGFLFFAAAKVPLTSATALWDTILGKGNFGENRKRLGIHWNEAMNSEEGTAWKKRIGRTLLAAGILLPVLPVLHAGVAVGAVPVIVLDKFDHEKLDIK